MVKKMKVGVVLSSGGGRGVFAHTGFLLALEQMGIEIGAIAGCSAGALVGGVYASGTDLQQWADRLASVQTRDYWTPDPWWRFIWQMVVRKGRGYTGLSESQAAIEFIRSNLAVQRFEACPIPFYCLATNLTQGTKTLFSTGDMAPRIMASAAMPLLYRPVMIDGELYSDGATIELASTEAICCHHNLDALIVHHASVCRDGPEGLDHALRQPWSLVEIIYLLLYRKRPWYLSDQAIAVHHCRCGCGVPVVVIEPDLPDITWPLSEGGGKIQMIARQQTEALLGLHIDALRKGLSLPGTDLRTDEGDESGP
ncbi:MAG: patatin-like phospholipase family protein [Gammaproteobacteria bacterium]|nr:patatin-like phospholipase family protein [Gammaproteobacteria bacterium]